MASSTQRVDPVEIAVAPASVQRMLALLFGVAPFAAFAVWTPFAVGPSRLFHSLGESSLVWWLYLIFLLPIAFFLRLAFPPRSAMARLQIRRDGISFIPSKWVKRYLAQPVVEAPITDHATRILLCQKGLPNGYAVIVRFSDQHDREIYADASLTLHSEEEAQNISKTISAVTGLPVSLITRQKRADGSIEETQWTPRVGRSELRLLAALASGILPLVGGGVTGYLVKQPVWIAAIGLSLWFARVIVFARFFRYKAKRSSSTIALSAAEFFLFEVWYAVAVIVVIYLFPHG